MPDQPWPSAVAQRTTFRPASISDPDPSGRVLRRIWALNAASTAAESIPVDHHQRPAGASPTAGAIPIAAHPGHRGRGPAIAGATSPRRVTSPPATLGAGRGPAVGKWLCARAVLAASVEAVPQFLPAAATHAPVTATRRS